MIGLRSRLVRSRITLWLSQGVIDEQTAERLSHFEDSHPRTGLPVMETVGVIALALGVIAVISANWQDLPVWAKLGGHALLNLLLGLGLWIGPGFSHWSNRAREILLAVLSASTLAFIAHVGQSFQLQGKVSAMLGIWLVLVSPMIFALARSTLNRWLWSVGMLATLMAFLGDYGETLRDAHLLTTISALVVVAGYSGILWGRMRAFLAPWGGHLHHLMLALVVAGVSLAQIAWRLDRHSLSADAQMDLAIGALVATIGLGAVHLALKMTGAHRWGKAVLVTISPAYALMPLLLANESPVFAAAGLCLYWAAIAYLAQASALTWLYRLAVTIIALRLVVVFLEAFGGLLMTGLGLVASGMVLLAIGFGLRLLLTRGARRSTP